MMKPFVWPLPGGSSECRGFSFVELIVVATILLLLLGVVVSQFRHGTPAAMKVASNLAFHMEVRGAVDKLTEALIEGTEIVKPLEGGSLTALVIKTIVNHIRVFYLERAANPAEGPFVMRMYTDNLTGRFEPAEHKTLFGNVKEVLFTSVSPGLVVINLVMVDAKGKELPAVFEVPLKNLGTVDER